MDHPPHTKNWFESAVSIYEIHLGSWRRVPEEHNRWLTYRELGDRLIPYVKEMGYSHIELLPIMEHPFDGSWGYQTSAISPSPAATARPLNSWSSSTAVHQAGLGVILDWTPAHFPRDPTASPNSTARISTNTPTRARARTRIGAPSSITTAATKSKIF